MENNRRGSIWNVQFTCIFLANALMYFGQYMAQTLVTKYASVLGASTATIGIIASAFAFTALIFKLFSGPAIDAFERKYIIFGAMLTLAAAFFGIGMAKSVQMIIAFRLLQGVAQAFTATGYLAMATDALPSDKIGSGLGIFTLAQSICMAISPTVGLAIANASSFKVTFIVAAALVCAAAFLSLIIKKSDKPKRKFAIRPENVFAKEAGMSMLLLFLIYVTQSLINSYLVIYATEVRGIGSIGIYFTVNTIVMLFTRPVIGRLTDKIGFTKTFIPAVICFAVSFLLVSIATNIGMFILAAVIQAFGSGVCHPLVNALCMKSVSDDRRGAGSSTGYIGVDLGNLVGPSLGAFVLSKFGYANMWRIMVIPVLLAGVITFIYRNKIRRIEKDYEITHAE